MTCIPLHVKKAPCAEYLHTACALVTFIVVRTTKVASRRLWAIDATPPGSAHPAMGADALRRHHRSSQARGVVHQSPPRPSPGLAVRAGGRHRGGQTPCRHPREGGRVHAGGVHVAYASPGHGRRDDPPVQMLSGRFRDGERAAAMLWMWRHASESGAFTIGTGTRRSFRDLMLALGAAYGRVPVITYVDMPEAMRPNAHINMSPRRRAAGCARSAITPRLCRSRMPCATSSPITCRNRTRGYKRRWAAGRHQTHACCDRRR
jgi:hypothetical protein